MERSELLETLDNDMKYVNAFRKKEAEWNELNSFEARMQLEDKNKKLKWILVIALPASFLFFNLINPFKAPDHIGDIFWGVVVAFLILYVLKMKDKKTYEKKLNDLEQELEALEESYHKNSILSLANKNIDKSERFYFYVSNSLADNLKECALLYFQEQQNKELIASMDGVADAVEESNSYIADQLANVNRSVQSVNNEVGKVNWTITKNNSRI